MGDVGVRDGQNHTKARPELFAQFGFEVNHVGRAVGSLLRVHAVVRGNAHNRSQFQQTAQRAVDVRVKLDGLGRAGRVSVLHVVGRGEVKEVGHPVFQKRDTGLENKQARLRTVDGRRGLADEFFDIVDPVRLHLRLVRLLGREGDAAGRACLGRTRGEGGHALSHKASRKNIPELLLGREDGDLAPGTRGGGKDRFGAQVPGRVHHHFPGGGGVVEEISADSMDRRGRAGDDRGIVDVGEGRHRGARQPAIAVHTDALEVRHPAPRQRRVEIFIGRTVEANDRDRAAGGMVRPSVDNECLCADRRHAFRQRIAGRLEFRLPRCRRCRHRGCRTRGRVRRVKSSAPVSGSGCCPW